MKEKIVSLPDSDLCRVVGGFEPDQLIRPAPSTVPLPCEYRFHADLTACPYTEAERLGFNCSDCSLRDPAKA